MKVDILRRIGAVVLMFLVLIGSMGFSMNLHYCKGDVKSFRIYGSAHSCYNQSDMKECTNPKGNGMSIHKKKCCEDVSIDYRSSFESRTAFEARNFPVERYAEIALFDLPDLAVKSQVIRTSIVEESSGIPPNRKYAVFEKYLI